MCGGSEKDYNTVRWFSTHVDVVTTRQLFVKRGRKKAEMQIVVLQSTPDGTSCFRIDYLHLNMCIEIPGATSKSYLKIYSQTRNRYMKTDTKTHSDHPKEEK